MRYIVKEKMTVPLGQIKDIFDQQGYVVTLTDNELAEGVKKGYRIEMDHSFELLKDEEKIPDKVVALSLVKEYPVLFAYFDHYGVSSGSAHYMYKISTGQWERLKAPNTPCLIVSCEADDTFLSSDYLKTIAVLHELAHTLKKRLVIWGNSQSQLPYYRRNSLTHDIVTYYIKKYKSLYLLPTTFEEGHERKNVGAISIWQESQLENIIGKWLGKDKQEQGLQEKSRGSQLCEKSQLMVPVSMLREEQQIKKVKGHYSGQKTWIGVLTQEHGHYQKASLLDEKNKMRVVGIWEQDQEAAGHYITGNDLMKVKGENTSLDHLLDLIGGKEMGLATSTQFVIGKMKKASSNEEGIRWENLKEAAEKLMRLAQANKRFLILIIPYGGYLLPCTGYKEWLKNFAKGPGRLVIIPAGDRGDKRHSLCLEGEAINWPINLVIKKPATIVGQIMLRYCEIGDFYLISPKGEKILLSKSKEQTLSEVKLYVEEKNEEETGEKPVYWTMENLEKGKWQLQMVIADKGLASGTMILQTPVKNAVWICEAKGKGTLMQADQRGIVSVGCFCDKEQILYGYSGRGDEAHWPTLVISDAFLDLGRWESTLSATGFFAGLVACLIEKWQKEERVISEAVLKKCLLWELMRIPDKKYPDSGQGYGILNVDSMTRLLGEE